MIQTERSAAQPQDFRLFLQQELIRRCRENRNYSLRAFARHLKLEPSFLSKLLRGERKFSLDVLQKLSDRLLLDPKDFDQYANDLRKQKEERKKTSRARNAKTEKSQHRQLTLDQFQLISEWYHYAILELLEVQNFEPSPRWMARALGISVVEVSAAIERLQRLEILAVDEKRGGWKNISGAHTTVGNPFTTAALRRLQKGVLERAIDALEVIPMERRDQSSITMAVDSRLLPEAKEKIKKFRRDLATFLQSTSVRDHVYHLSVSLYPVTQFTKEKPDNKEVQ